MCSVWDNGEEAGEIFTKNVTPKLRYGGGT